MLKKYANQIIMVSLLFAGSFTLLGIVLSPYLIKAMGATGELARLGNIYLRITFFRYDFFIFIFLILIP